jgi:CheY-like chemotaxis protein
LPRLVTILVVGLDDLLLMDLQSTAPPEIGIESATRLPIVPGSPAGAYGGAVVLDMDAPGAADTARGLAALADPPPILGLVSAIQPDRSTPLAVVIDQARASGVTQVLPKPIDAADLLSEALKAVHARAPSPALAALASKLEAQLRY